jgi:type I restriction enzyme M protein
MNTAQWIRDRRMSSGFSQAELARRVGASQPMISQWERGVSAPPPDLLKKLEKVLGKAAPSAPAKPEPPPEPVASEPVVRALRKAKKGERSASGNGSGANLGFEKTLWDAADRLRGHMDASEYKHVVLGLIFLKYISDAFEDLHAKLEATPGDDPEDPDEYLAQSIFWVPQEARWSGPRGIQAQARKAEIGKVIDAAMTAIERENPTLKGVLPKDYGRPSLDKARLAELVDRVSSIGLGDVASQSQDILGRVYEYFLGEFAQKEGKSGGEFFTPQCVVKLLVEMIEPLKGRVYDPCCGSGGMFVQSQRFVKAHGGRRGDIAIYGQESNNTTWRLARMNLAIRGIDANLGSHNADSFLNDLHPEMRADYILANPPFNMSYWGGETLKDDIRWKEFGVPPASNANYAWIQHFIHHLSPRGIAGFVMANGSLSSNQSGEGEIRRKIIDADLVDCIIALPPQLFYTTGIPVCLWFLARDKGDRRFRARHEETLFIDARKMGYLIDRTHRELKDKEEIGEIARTYHAWRGEKGAGKYEDRAGFCKATATKEIEEHGGVLTPGRYVGAGQTKEDEEPFEERMLRLVEDLKNQFIGSSQLELLIRKNLRDLGHEV